MKIFKDITRLPAVFLPMFVTGFLAVILLLMSGAVRNACADAKAKTESMYDADMSIVLKQRYEKVLDEKTGNYVSKNINEKKIDTSVLKALEGMEGVEDISYITNWQLVWLRYAINAERLSEIEKQIENGEEFIFPAQPITSGGSTRFDYNMFAITDEHYIEEIYGCENHEITYVNGAGFGDGVIFSKALYEYYGEPSELVFGWYTVLESGQIMDMEGDLSLKSDAQLEWIKKAFAKEAPPAVRIKVAGYFTSDGNDTGAVNTIAFAPPEIWQQVYEVCNYYSLNYSAGAEPPTALDDIGATRLDAHIKRASDAPAVTQRLLDEGLDTLNYLVTADDYDYKFAAAQTDSIGRFSEVLYWVAAAFGCATVFIALCYAVSKRRREIYTLRTIGRSPLKTVLALGFENSFMLLAPIVLGGITGSLVGDGLCTVVNRIMKSNVTESVEKLSKVTEFMSNSDDLRERLAEATEAYLNAGIELTYRADTVLYKYLIIAWLVFSVIGIALLMFLYRNSLMKKEG